MAQALARRFLPSRVALDDEVGMAMLSAPPFDADWIKQVPRQSHL